LLTTSDFSKAKERKGEISRDRKNSQALTKGGDAPFLSDSKNADGGSKKRKIKATSIFQNSEEERLAVGRKEIRRTNLLPNEEKGEGRTLSSTLHG